MKKKSRRWRRKGQKRRRRRKAEIGSERSGNGTLLCPFQPNQTLQN